MDDENATRRCGGDHDVCGNRCAGSGREPDRPVALRRALLGPPGSFAYITQNGWELNIVNDAGEPSRAWVDYPGRIWVERAQQGAIYSPDGNTLQFDRGSLWRRAP